MSLLRKTLRSALWMGARLVGRQLANILIFFWLVTVLSPNEVGLATLAVTIPMFCLPMVIRGVRDFVIQSDTLDDEVVATAYWTNVLVGAAVSLLIVGAAPHIAEIVGHSGLAPLIRTAGLIPLVAALGDVHAALLERQFQHHRIAIIHLVGSAVAGVVAVGVALYGYELWTLVVFNLCLQSCVTLLLCGQARWQPITLWSPKRAIEQIRFAAPIVVSTTIAVGNQRVVEVLTAILLTPSAVAWFRLGGNILRLLNQSLVTPILQVLLPAFARSQAAPETNLFRALVVNSSLLFPVFLGAAAILPDVIGFALSPQWEGAGAVAAILCYNVFGALIGPISYPMLIAKNREIWTTVLAVTGIAVTIAFVIVGGQYGVVGVALGFVARALLTIPLTLWVLKRALDTSPSKLIAAFAPFAILAVAMNLFLMFVLSPLLADLFAPTRVVILIAAGVATYGIGLRFIIPRVSPDAYRALCSVLPAALRRWA